MAERKTKALPQQKAAALQSLGLEPNVPPRRRGATVPTPPLMQSTPAAWRGDLDDVPAVTSLRVKVSERASVRRLRQHAAKLEPSDLLKFPNLARYSHASESDERLAEFLRVAAELPHLVWLRLDGVNERLPPEIGLLRALHCLELRGDWSLNRGPRELPTELWHLPALEQLDLHNGRMESLQGIGDARALRVLDLGSNAPLTTLPEDFGALSNLRLLDLQTPNELDPAQVFSVITRLPQLRRLRFRKKLAFEVPSTIAELRTLEYLCLGSAISELPDAISGLRALRFLDLEFNDVRCLSESLTELPALEVLKLHANPNLDLRQALPIALRCPALRQLLLPARGLDKAGAAALEDAGFAQTRWMYGDLWIRGTGPLLCWQTFSE